MNKQWASPLSPLSPLETLQGSWTDVEGPKEEENKSGGSGALLEMRLEHMYILCTESTPLFHALFYEAGALSRDIVFHIEFIRRR